MREYWQPMRALRNSLHGVSRPGFRFTRIGRGAAAEPHIDLLALPRVGSTPLGLRPLIEVVRYHNRALEELIVPFDLSSAQLLITAACRFHCAFHAACQAHHRVCGGFAAAAAATGHSSNAESA